MGRIRPASAVGPVFLWDDKMTFEDFGYFEYRYIIFFGAIDFGTLWIKPVTSQKIRYTHQGGEHFFGVFFFAIAMNNFNFTGNRGETLTI